VTPDFGKACRTRVPIDKVEYQYIKAQNREAEGLRGLETD